MRKASEMVAVGTKIITAEDVAVAEDSGLIREIVGGQWVEDAELPFKEHGYYAGQVFGYLFIYLQQNKIGRLYTDNTNYVLKGTKDKIEVMRIRDVSFVRAERVVDEREPGYYYIAPDLAVEIVSSRERPGIINAKISDYLTYGTQQIWVVYPNERKVVVYFPEGAPQVYGENDTLTGGQLLPNFSLPVKAIFE